MPYLDGLLTDLVGARDPARTEYVFVHFYTHAVVIGKRAER